MSRDDYEYRNNLGDYAPGKSWTGPPSKEELFMRLERMVLELQSRVKQLEKRDTKLKHD